MKIIRGFVIAILLLVSGSTQVKALPQNLLEQEAGIAAFFSFPGLTNLQSNLLRNQFRTISTEGTNYIVGFVPVVGFENYPQMDVKAIVHNSGWVVAYYPKDKPVALILKDFNQPNRLETTLAKIAYGLDVQTYQAFYTDFEHPRAQKMLLIQMSRKAGDRSFNFNLPFTGEYYDRSFIVDANGLVTGLRFKLDSRVLADIYSGLLSNKISSQDMVSGAKHVVDLYACCNAGYLGMAILYTGNNSPVVNYAEAISIIDLVSAPDQFNNAVKDIPIYFDYFLPVLQG